MIVDHRRLGISNRKLRRQKRDPDSLVQKPRPARVQQWPVFETGKTACPGYEVLAANRVKQSFFAVPGTSGRLAIYQYWPEFGEPEPSALPAFPT
jgi:hypothetical protein